MRKILTVLSVLSLGLAMLGGCPPPAGAADPEKPALKVGSFASSAISARAGIATLEEMGYKVELVMFDDAVLPNIALQEGSIDYNIYQHKPYLEAYLQKNPGVELSMPRLFYYPNYGLYSVRHSSVDQLPDGAKIGLYSDASNVDRGLRILAANGLIKLTDKEKLMYSDLDVVENPKKLKFELVNFGTAVRSLEDLDASMAAASHILDAGMDPTRALLLEDKDKTSADFTCGIAIRARDENRPWVKDVLTAYTSEASRRYLEENYRGASVPAF